MSRLDTRESKWWEAFEAWCAQYGIDTDSPAHDELFTIVLEAIQEDGAVEAASRGGRKGGPARAANMTPEERSYQASQAARARWGKT